MIEEILKEPVKTQTKTQAIYNPATGQVIKEITLGSENDAKKAVAKAKAALKGWRKLSPLKRARILFKYNELLNQHKEALAKLITLEHGKVHADALGEVQRGIEIVEFACGIPHLLKGEHSHQVSSAIDSYGIRQSVGVCVGITPFNFPMMVPMWMFPIALACGNTFVLKPSERDPSVTMRIVELMYEAGLPEDVLQVINGDKTVVDTLIQHPDVAAVSFVGSTPIAKYIYETAAKNGKRVQALGGAKNHCTVMPDANMDNAVNGLIGAAFGSAGERCMAISVAVAVGDATADKLVQKLSEKIEQLKVAPGDVADADMGPVITAEHRKRIINYIDLGIEQGATLIKDGRSFTYPGHEDGFFVGPALFDHVTPEMTIYQEEIFGPVLCVVRVKTLQEAIDLINQNSFANGATIYTNNGANARVYTDEIEIGMVGVNVPIPVPMAFHSFGGWKSSLFGDTHVHGPEGIHFYTRLKTITTRWHDGDSDLTNQLSMPTLQ
ncbi:CoA-acylating methylmalonate-semialdehyde dehydrogenase [Facilibium subflavum]|uniref:CoA-acylating methylmalonate-semialdehyde dehydrogenase n=1 Tax=Facilibium subflavum TaxID=2219058 RepID=UPI000E657489|nr:CoA-acylating methylmalonate-semialdehyde dehydrogenase [Facilibium subflavum]